VKSGNGTQVPLSMLAHWEQSRAQLAIGHQGQFPSTVISFNLAPGKALGDAVKAVNRIEQRIQMPASHQCQLPGHGRGVSDFAGQRAAPDSGRAGHRLHRAGRALRELHSPHHDHLFAALGGRGRAAGAADHAHTDFSVIALIGIILLIGIVQKNAIMMIDFALQAERKEGKPPRSDLFRPACCASGPS
jgi:multidrug efflux pump